MGPLEGLRVIDLGTLIAGPLTATFLADLGAEVIKVEHPRAGDHIRNFGPQKSGVGIYSKAITRNKKCITLDLSKPEGQDVLCRLTAKADAIVENFRPGTLERWNVSYERLKSINPKLIMLRTSGFGHGGPYTPFPSFGTLAEAMSGFSHVTGTPDRPPMLPQFPLADGCAAMMGAIGMLAAVYHRDVRGGEGQWIDNTIYEPLMRMLEVMLMEYDQLGTVRERMGNQIPDVAPRGAYKTREGRWVALSGGAPAAAKRILQAIDREDLVTDPRFCDNQSRIKNVISMDEAIGEWVGRHTMPEVLERFRAYDAPIAPVYNSKDIFADPHFQERQTFVTVTDQELGPMRMMNVQPRLSATPGEIKFSGPPTGANNEEIYCDLLGMTRQELESLKTSGIV